MPHDRYDYAVTRARRALLAGMEPKTLWSFGDSPYDDDANGANLFAATGPDCGCLTQVRNWSANFAPSCEITQAIRADERIPKNPSDITVDDLHVFAAWQRKLDRELGPWEDR